MGHIETGRGLYVLFHAARRLRAPQAVSCLILAATLSPAHWPSHPDSGIAYRAAAPPRYSPSPKAWFPSGVDILSRSLRTFHAMTGERSRYVANSRTESQALRAIQNISW